MTVKAFGAYAADKSLEAIDIDRRAPGDHDVQIDIAYCGVCHSDLHTVRGEWAPARSTRACRGTRSWAACRPWARG
jgi:D-arabinose 1-dehydrogenase-like Zn-dependent alcohol dehydrogenase